MLFSYSIFGWLATVIILAIESAVNWTPWRFSNYTGEQYGWMILAASVSTLSLVCNIIAAQNEKTAIIQMIGYISLVYAFLGDFFIFDLTLNPLQIIGVLVVLAFSISMIIYNCMHAGPKATQEIKNKLAKGDTKGLPTDL